MPWNTAKRVLGTSAEITVIGTLIGGLIGAGAMLFIVAVFDSRAPVMVLEASELDGAVQRNGVLEMRFRFLRTQECNSVAGYWLWQMRPDGRGEPLRYVVSLGTSQVTIADPSPLTQDMVIAFNLPAAVTPGEWNLRMKYLDYCRLLSPIVGPTVRVLKDVPIRIVERRS